MLEIAAAMGAGILGGILFLVADLLFGGNRDSAYTACLYGFWIFIAVGWLANRPGSRPVFAGLGAAGPGGRFQASTMIAPVPAVRFQPPAPALSRPPVPDGAEELVLTHVVGETGGDRRGSAFLDHILELEAEAIFRAADLGHLDRAIEIHRRSRRWLAGCRAGIELFDHLIRERFACGLAAARMGGNEATVRRLKQAYADLMIMEPI